MGLLELRPWKPRTVGLLGVIASAMNCYLLWPGTLPLSLPPRGAAAAAAAPGQPKLVAKTS